MVVTAVDHGPLGEPAKLGGDVLTELQGPIPRGKVVAMRVDDGVYIGVKAWTPDDISHVAIAQALVEEFFPGRKLFEAVEGQTVATVEPGILIAGSKYQVHPDGVVIVEEMVSGAFGHFTSQMFAATANVDIDAVEIPSPTDLLGKYLTRELKRTRAAADASGPDNATGHVNLPPPPGTM